MQPPNDPASPNDPFQPQQPPAASAGGRIAPQKPRETTIPKTLGILNLVFGVIFMLAGAGTAVQYVMMPMLGDVMEAQQQQIADGIESQQDSALKKLLEDQTAAASEDKKAAIQTQIDQIKNRPRITPPNMAGMMGMTDRRVMVWGVINGLSGAFLNLLMIISGVGLLLLKGWGRSLAIWVAGLKIIRLIGSTSYYCFVCVPVIAQTMINTMQQMTAQAGPAPQQAPAEMGAWFVGIYCATAVGFAIAASIYPIICLVLLTRSRVKAAFNNASVTAPQ